MKNLRTISQALLTSGFVTALAFSLPTHSQDTPQARSTERTATDYWSDFKHDAGETWQDSKEAFRDGWIESKLETAMLMSDHLNPFKINIDVEDDTAILTGSVDSELVKDHATLVALSIDGIDSVTNKLKVDKNAQRRGAATDDGRRSFTQTMQDAAITADIKTELLRTSEIEGLDIDVDTYNGAVTLSGEVDTPTKRILAEYIARSNENVNSVINKLEVGS